MRAMLIRSPHIEKILAGTKTWEIRGSRTHVREQIGLIRSGSGTVIGVCDVVECLGPLTADQYQKGARKAGIKPNEARVRPYKKTYAWVLANARNLKRAVSYSHQCGAVIWVKLNAQTDRAVQRALMG